MDNPGTGAERQGIETLTLQTVCSPWTAETGSRSSPHTEKPRIRGRVCAMPTLPRMVRGTATTRCSRQAKKEESEACRTCPIPASAQTTGSLVWCSCGLQRNGKRKWCPEGSIQWTPAAWNTAYLIRSHPHPSDHCRRQSMSKAGERRSAETGELLGPLAAEECMGIRCCRSNEGDRGSSEGKAHPHHERVSCCVWLTDHGLITRMAANKSKSLSPHGLMSYWAVWLRGRRGFPRFVRTDLPR